MRIADEVVPIDKYDVPKFFSALNKCKWFLTDGKKVVAGKIDSKSERARIIKDAYDAGKELDTLSGAESLKKRDKDNRDELFNYLLGMKPQMRDRWLQDEQELKKKYDRWLKNQSKQNEVNE